MSGLSCLPLGGSTQELIICRPRDDNGPFFIVTDSLGGTMLYTIIVRADGVRRYFHLIDPDGQTVYLATKTNRRLMHRVWHVRDPLDKVIYTARGRLTSIHQKFQIFAGNAHFSKRNPIFGEMKHEFEIQRPSIRMPLNVLVYASNGRLVAESFEWLIDGTRLDSDVNFSLVVRHPADTALMVLILAVSIVGWQGDLPQGDSELLEEVPSDLYTGGDDDKDDEDEEKEEESNPSFTNSSMVSDGCGHPCCNAGTVPQTTVAPSVAVEDLNTANVAHQWY